MSGGITVFAQKGYGLFHLFGKVALISRITRIKILLVNHYENMLASHKRSKKAYIFIRTVIVENHVYFKMIHSVNAHAVAASKLCGIFFLKAVGCAWLFITAVQTEKSLYTAFLQRCHR